LGLAWVLPGRLPSGPEARLGLTAFGAATVRLLPLVTDAHVDEAARWLSAGPVLLCGFTLAAILAPFPFVLIGYGASPILGFALALGRLAGDSGASGGFRASP
jgi:hypothetical protein